VKIGIALGGGGARGIAHIGVLKTLEAQNIPIDIICGTSMGSVIGAMYAFDPHAAHVEKKIKDYYTQHGIGSGWLNFLSKEEDEFKGSFLMEMSYFVRKKYMALAALRRAGLENAEALRRPLEKLLPDCNIEDLRIPFAAVATNLTEGTDEAFAEGSLIDAVYASSAIEGIFPPLARNGRLYSDGGPTANTPIEACRQMGADLVIAVFLPATLKREEKFANGLEVILRVDLIASVKLGRTLLDQADIVICPEVGDIHWAAFKKLDDCIDLGLRAAEKALPEIIAKLKPRRSPFSRLRQYIRAKLSQD